MRDECRRLHDVPEPAPRRLEDRPKVRERLARFGLEAAFDHLGGRGIDARLPGHEQEVSGSDKLRVMGQRLRHGRTRDWCMVHGGIPPWRQA
jgi:hypothetical protein